MASIDLSGLAVNRRYKMGRPPDCHCHCGEAVPPPPDFEASFFVLVFQDESAGQVGTYSRQSTSANMLADLKYLREKEQAIGRVNMALLQPGTKDVDLLKHSSFSGGGPEGLPVEVVYYSNCTRGAVSNDDRAKLIYITNELIRGNFQCIGVFIDDSGSMRRSTVGDIVDEWYWNISTSESSHSTYTRYIVDPDGNPWPLPSCTSGKIGLGTANGCVKEITTSSERWLKVAADNAQSIYDDPDGCTGVTCCSTKAGWPEICAVASDITETPATVNFNISWIIEGTETDDDKAGNPASAVTLEDKFGNTTKAEFKAEVMEAFAVWKTALDNMCSWLTVTFTDIGDETGTTVPSKVSYGNYNLPHNDNIGDLRIGMHNIDSVKFGVLAHAWYPDGVLGSVGNYGGDMHFDSSEAWRKDNESVSGAISIKWAAVHEIGHALGIPHIEPPAIMSAFAPAEIITGQFDTTYAGGVVGSTSDYNALKEVYCIS